MNLLGLDYGEKKIGVAISLGVYAEGIKVINNKEAIIRIKQICEKEKIGKIIIGLPEGRLVGEIRTFGENLKKKLLLPVEFWDETLTTDHAEQMLILSGKSRKRRKEQEDQMAAAEILQSYIDSNK